MEMKIVKVQVEIATTNKDYQWWDADVLGAVQKTLRKSDDLTIREAIVNCTEVRYFSESACDHCRKVAQLKAVGEYDEKEDNGSIASLSLAADGEDEAFTTAEIMRNIADKLVEGHTEADLKRARNVIYTCIKMMRKSGELMADIMDLRDQLEREKTLRLTAEAQVALEKRNRRGKGEDEKAK